MMEFPSWLKAVAPGWFVLDPDFAYPEIIKMLGLREQDLTRHDMVVVNGVAKKLARVMARRHPDGPCRTLTIRGDEGRARRWAVRFFPLGGKPDISLPHETAARNAAVNAAWRRLFG